MQAVIQSLEKAGRDHQDKYERRRKKQKKRTDNTSPGFFQQLAALGQQNRNETHEDFLIWKEKNRQLQKRLEDAVRQRKIDRELHQNHQSIINKTVHQRHCLKDIYEKFEEDGRRFKKESKLKREKTREQNNIQVSLRVKQLYLQRSMANK